MKKTHVPCSLKIEEEAVRYDLDNPTKRNTAKLLQLFLTALGYFGSVLVICDLYGTNIRKEIFLPLAIGGFLLASLLQFLPKHSGKLTLGFVLGAFGHVCPVFQTGRAGFSCHFQCGLPDGSQYKYRIFSDRQRGEHHFCGNADRHTCGGTAGISLCLLHHSKAAFHTAYRSFFPACRAGAVSRNPCQRSGNGAASGILGRHAGTAVSGTVGTGEDPLHTAYLAIGGSLTALLILLVYGTVSLTGTWQGYSRPESDKLRRQEISEVWRISTFRICPRAFARSLRQSAWATTRLSPSETLPNSGYTTGQI